MSSPIDKPDEQETTTHDTGSIKLRAKKRYDYGDPSDPLFDRYVLPAELNLLASQKESTLPPS